MLNLLAAKDPIEDVIQHPLFHVTGPFYVTNHMMMALIAAVLMLLIFPTLFGKARSDAPSGARNFFEAILEYLRLEVFRPALKENTDKFLPFLWTLFFFILFCNLLGQIPVDEIVTIFVGHEVHFWGTATGAMQTTGALAICAFFCIHVNGLIQITRSLINGTYGQHGHHTEHSSNGQPPHEAAVDLEHMRGEALAADLPANLDALKAPTSHYTDDEFPQVDLKPREFGQHVHHKGMNPVAAVLLAGPLYIWNFAPHPFRPQPGQSKLLWLGDVPMWFVLLVLELLGALIKPFALMVRLFANMLAGHVILASLVILIPVAAGVALQLGVGIPITIVSVLMRFLELFVAVLQTYIFVFLTTLFLASAVAPEH
jgi:F0F1-type ATP synthase membrane subunit a